MTPIVIVRGLPFISVTVYANGKSLTFDRVLLDTGSQATAFKTLELEKLGVEVELSDRIRVMSGIGGAETVIEKRIEAIEVGSLRIGSFTIQMGALEYNIPLDGILGVDFLQGVGAQINFKTLTLDVG